LSASGANYGDYQFILMDRDNDGSPAKTAVTRAPERPSPQKSALNIVSAPSGALISMPEGGRLAIVTMLGKPVRCTAQTERNASFIRWKAPSPGIYLVKYSCNGGKTVCKLIVQ
jgi:hypothetical protein